MQDTTFAVVRDLAKIRRGHQISLNRMKRLGVKPVERPKRYEAWANPARTRP